MPNTLKDAASWRDELFPYGKEPLWDERGEQMTAEDVIAVTQHVMEDARPFGLDSVRHAFTLQSVAASAGGHAVEMGYDSPGETALFILPTAIIDGRPADASEAWEHYEQILTMPRLDTWRATAEKVVYSHGGTTSLIVSFGHHLEVRRFKGKNLVRGMTTGRMVLHRTTGLGWDARHILVGREELIKDGRIRSSVRNELFFAKKDGANGAGDTPVINQPMGSELQIYFDEPRFPLNRPLTSNEWWALRIAPLRAEHVLKAA